MTVTSLVADIAPRTCKISNNGPSVFEKILEICYKMVHTFVFMLSQMVRNRVGKLEFTQTKNRLGTKG